MKQIMGKLMQNEVIIYNDNEIQNRILTIKNQQVMIDRDLAELYEVETKVLNQAVKRNIERFPSNFMFQLSDDEKNELVTNCDRFKTLKHSSSLPYAFTEQGVAMLSAVLKSDTAVRTSIMIMNAFSKTKITSLDVQKFNAQYSTLSLNFTSKMHDRFLIIDNKVLYHIGASLKDLAKKCFAFEILDSSLIPSMLGNL